MLGKTFEKYCLVIDEWFVNGWNGTKAYQKFYPKAKDDTAAVKFNELVRIGKIDAYITEKKVKALETLKTSHEALLKELENWAYSDITETIMLSPEQVKELPNDIRRLITKFKTTTKRYKDSDDEWITETLVELHFVSKEKAMEMIHKHVGFYERDNTQKQPINTQILSVDPLSSYDKDDNSTTED
ncbi:MAG: hypothetical protein GY740_25385 [Gammaproteobacteria bacterium]|nr:hypothetical protein [Gammaproteobacteria bacterium]